MLDFFQSITSLQWVTITSTIVFGTVLALIGSIKLPLAKRLQMGEERVGKMISVLTFALIPMMFGTGILVDVWSIQGMILAGSILTAFGIAGLGLAPSYRGALGAILLTGLAGSSLSVAAVKLMPQVFFDGNNPTAAQNLGNMFFGLGALLTPLAAMLLIRWIGFRTSILLVALALLVPAILAGLTPGEDWDNIRPPEELDLTDLPAIGSDPVFWLTSAALFFYIPLEFIIGAWATTYLTGRGFSERHASLLLSGFWLALMLARLGSTFLLEVFRVHKMLPDGAAVMLLLLALLAALLLAMLITVQDRLWVGVCICLVGVSFGPIFPTLVGLLNEYMKAHGRNSIWGTAYGATFSIGLIGGMIIPPIIGYLARRYSLQKALGVTVLVALILAAATALLGFEL